MTDDQQKSKSRHTPYSRLRIGLAMMLVIVSLSPMILVSGIILYQFHIFSNEMVYAHLGELVLKHRQKIDDFLKHKLSDISHLSKSYDLEQFKNEAFLLKCLRSLQEDYSFVFVDLGVIDKNGHQVSYAGPFDLKMANYSQADWFQNAIKSDVYISDVFLGIRGQPHFIISVKRRWDNNEWLIRATIDFFAFNMLVEDIAIGTTGTAFILNRQGDFQTRPPKGDPKLTRQQYINLFKKGDDALHNVTFDSDSIHEDIYLAKNANLDRKNSVFTVIKTGEQGSKFIIVASFLKNNEWLLVFQQEFKDAFEKLHTTQKMAGMIAFVGALCIIAVDLIVSVQMIRRISKLDSEKEVMNQQIIETGKLASVGQLAAGIAHEINNPVAIMIEEAGWIQDLLSEGIDKENNREEMDRALKQIVTQGRRCKDITQKLLSFARKTDSRIQTLQINEFIPEVVGLLSEKTKYANVAVELQLQSELPTIQASPTEMQQVLMNILHNAVYAMERTGGKIIISTRSDNDSIFISIADTGPGIPASNIGRIFDPFFTTKPVGKGTGLGLSICYGIINKMGGRIDVESQMGKGTTFTILLPLQKEAAAK